MNGTILTGITLLAFIVLHSITASLFFKAWAKSFLGEQAFEIWFRFIYNLISIISLVPVMIELRIPTFLLWKTSGIVPGIFYIIQLVGVIGMAVTLLQIDVLSFVGIRQLFSHSESKPQEPEKLVIDGLYKIVRHPLYLFSMLVIWFVPTMSESWFVFSLFSTLYFYIGSYFEERKMLIQFGDAYRQYQHSIPRIIPFLKPRKL